MTRKDYEAIAGIIKDNCEGRYCSHHTGISPSAEWQSARGVVNRVASQLADYMATDNPRFDRDKFIQACDGGE